MSEAYEWLSHLHPTPPKFDFDTVDRTEIKQQATYVLFRLHKQKPTELHLMTSVFLSLVQEQSISNKTSKSEKGIEQHIIQKEYYVSLLRYSSLVADGTHESELKPQYLGKFVKNWTAVRRWRLAEETAGQSRMSFLYFTYVVLFTVSRVTKALEQYAPTSQIRHVSSSGYESLWWSTLADDFSTTLHGEKQKSCTKRTVYTSVYWAIVVSQKRSYKYKTARMVVAAMNLTKELVTNIIPASKKRTNFCQPVYRDSAANVLQAYESHLTRTKSSYLFSHFHQLLTFELPYSV